MNDKMVLGQYYHTNSVIHRIDARTKLITLIILMVAIFLIPSRNINIYSFVMLGIMGIFVIVCIILSRVPILKFIKSLRHILFLMIFALFFQLLINNPESGITGTLIDTKLNFTIINILVVILIIFLYFLIRRFLPLKFIILIGVIIGCIFIFQYPLFGNILFSINFKLYKSGLLTGGFIVGRIVIIVFFSTILTLTTKPMDLANALEWWLKPLELIKIPTSIFAIMISIALRFIPTLFNETDKIMKAQASRGADFKESSFREQIMQIISLLVPMFVISFKRAIDLADAMEARGYIPGAKRTRLLKMKFHFRDILTTILVMLLLATIITLRIVL